MNPIFTLFFLLLMGRNRQRLNKALYLNRALYSSGITNKRKQIAEENGVENLVAGAWGCGVFMQDPYTVATLLIGAARNYNIPNIYFAIPDRNSQNFRAYKQLIIARKDSLGKQRSGSGKRWHYVSYGYKSRYRLIP